MYNSRVQITYFPNHS